MRRFSRQGVKRVPPNVPKDVIAREAPVDTGPGRMGTMGAPPSGIIGRPHSLTQIVYPPWIFPPGEAARYFNPSAQATVGPGPVGPTELAASVFEIPSQNMGVIREITFNVNNLLVTSAITFQLLFNGGPVEGHGAISIFPRAAASVSVAFLSESTVLHVPENTRISWAVTVGDAIAYQLGVNYRGWFYSKTVAGRYHKA